jgi:uncharacterized protein YjbI with pentapeptide repeats
MSSNRSNSINVNINNHLVIGPRADLRGAHLEGRDLRGANLEEAHLEGAYLEGAHLEKANLERAYLRGAHLEGTYLEEANLKKADLRGATLIRANLSLTNLRGADLTGANLSEANLYGAHLERAILIIANLEGAHLEGTYLEEAHLKGADLRGATLIRANLSWTILRGAHLEGAHLEEAHLEGANLTKAYLEGAHLERAVLKVAGLEGADLRGANLELANLKEANLKGANLIRANLIRAHLEGAHLTEANLSEANLYGAHLEGANLTGTHLERANLEGADLIEAHLAESYLEGAHLEEANLYEAHLEGAHLQGAHLRRAYLREAHLERAHLEGAILRGANLEGAHFERAHLEEAHLEGAHLQGAHLEEANLYDAHLEEAHLEGAHLQGAHLEGANLTGTHLERANLEGADLRQAHLEGAHLQGAHLRRAYLREANLTGANLTGTDLTRAILTNVILSDVQRAQIAATHAQIQQIAANRLRRISQQRNGSLSSFQQIPSHASKIIFIRRQLHTPRNLGSGPKNNSSSNSCPNFKHLYDFIMEQELTDGFRFEFEDIDVIDITGLTRQVFDKILPVYVHLFFIKNPGEEFMLLKEKVNMEQLNQHTIQLIKLAKAAHAQIILRINPEVIEFLSLENPPQSIANNQNFNKLYAIFKEQINSSGNNVSNYLLNNSLKPKINSAKGNLDALNRALKQEILFRKKLNGFGFTSLEQYSNMARFIKIFWNTSNDNKVTIEKVTLDLFANNINFDVESFRGRIKIIRSNGDVLDLSRIPPDLYQVYPGLKPLLEYILSESEDGNENRKIFTKFVSGTEYFLGQLKISLTNQTMSPRYNNSPFFGHTCDYRIDMFKAPANFNREITQNVINAQLRATTSSFQGSE